MAKRAHQQVPPSATGANDTLGRTTGGSVILIDGSSAPVGAVNTASIRYLDSTSKLQVSLDGAAYTDIATGSGMTIGGAVTSGTVGSVLFVGTGSVLQQDTGLTWDNSTKTLRIVGDGATTSERSIAGTTTGLLVAFGVQSTTTGDMVDGFSALTSYRIRDTGMGNASAIGYMGATRAGADNTGALIFAPLSAGTAVPFVRMSPNSSLELHSGAFGSQVLQQEMSAVSGAVFHMLNDGASAAISASNTARIRYNNSTTKLQVSLNGNAYVDVTTGAIGSAISIGATVVSGSSGSVLFVDASGNLQQDSTNFNWNDTTNILTLSKVRSGDGTSTDMGFGFSGDATMGMRRSTNDLVVHAASGGNVQLATGSTSRINVSSGALTPVTDGAMDLGAVSSNFRFRYLYLSRAVGIEQAVQTAGSARAFYIIGGAHTNQSGGVESPDVWFNLARTVQFAGGVTTQRTVKIQAPTYSMVSADTMTTAATVAISGAPVAGTNATITNRYALWVEDGQTKLVNNSENTLSTLAVEKVNGGSTGHGISVSMGAGNAAGSALDISQQGSGSGSKGITILMATGGGSASGLALDITANNINVGNLLKGIRLTNTTAAISGTQQASPDIRFTGQGFSTTGSVSRTVEWSVRNLPVQGATASSLLEFAYQINAGGFTSVVQFGSDATLILADGVNASVGQANTSKLRYNDTAGKLQVSLDGAAYVDLATGSTTGTAIGASVTGGTQGAILFVGPGPVLAEDTGSLFWDDTGKSLRVSAFAGPVILGERSVAVTTGGLTALTAQLSTSGDMTDGFGPLTLYRIKDTAAVENPIGYMGALRDGADNSGSLVFAAYSAGTIYPFVKMTKDLSLQIYSGVSGSQVLQQELSAVSGAVFHSLADGASAAVSAANTARLRYLDSTSKLQVSLDGNAYIDIATGAGGGGSMTIGGAVTSGTNKSVLFVDSSGNLAQDNAAFNFDTATDALTVTNLKIGDGTGSAPSFSFSGDATMGISRSGEFLFIHTASSASNGAMYFCTGATQRIAMDATLFSPMADNAMDLGSSGGSWRDLYVARDAFFDGTTTVGPARTNTAFGATILSDFNGADNGTPALQLGSFGDSAGPFQLRFIRANGPSASPTPVLETQGLGALVWMAQFDTGATDLFPGVWVEGHAAEDHSSTNRGAYLKFSVTPEGSAAGIVETLRLSGITYGSGTSRQLLEFAGAVITSPTLLALPTGTEVNNVLFDNADTWTWTSGAITTQRHVLITPPTYAFDGASTVSNAATVGISGAPIAGTNATITHSSCLLLDPGASGNGISINQSGTGVGQAALRVVLTNAAAKAMLVTETGNGTQPMFDLNRSGTSSASIINATGGASTTGAIFNLTQAGAGTGITVTNTYATNPWCFEGICNGVTPLETARFGLRMRSGASDATDTVKYSPMVVLKGAAWTGSVDENVEFCFQVRPAAAATPTGVLHILYGLGGGVLASRLRLSSVGTLGLNVQSSDPTPSEGDVWYNGTSDVLKYRDGTATQTVAATGVAQSFSKQQSSTPFALTDGANIAVNALNSNVFTVTLGGNRTLDNPTNLAAGQTFMFIITQDGTGSRTLSYGTAYDFGAEGAPTLTTAAGKVDVISGIALSTTKIACTVIKGFL